jgi:hypothetical protein
VVGKVLASGQLEVVLPVDAKKKEKEGDDDDPAPASAIPGTTKTILTLSEMLQHLSSQFNKPQTGHKTRVGLFDFYTSLLSTLGPGFVESHYGEIVQHLMHDIVSNSRNLNGRFDVLFVRKLVGIVLRELIGVRMLGEQAQIGSIQELSNAYLKRWPAFMPGQNAPHPYVLAVALREVAGLLQQLGNAPPPVQVCLLLPFQDIHSLRARKRSLNHSLHFWRIQAIACAFMPVVLSEFSALRLPFGSRKSSSMFSSSFSAT